MILFVERRALLKTASYASKTRKKIAPKDVPKDAQLPRGLRKKTAGFLLTQNPGFRAVCVMSYRALQASSVSEISPGVLACLKPEEARVFLARHHTIRIKSKLFLKLKTSR